MRELVYYAAVTLDGFIAGPDGQFDAFLFEGDHMDAINDRFADTIPTDFAESLGVRQQNSMFDTVMMGWNTYQVGKMASPYRHLRQIVFSRSHSVEAENLEVSADDPKTVVRRLKEEPGASIWLCGGGALAASLSDDIDRLVLKRQPLVFGDGIPLFEPGAYAPSIFDEVRTTVFESGVVFSEYVRRSDA